MRYLKVICHKLRASLKTGDLLSTGNQEAQEEVKVHPSVPRGDSGEMLGKKRVSSE